MRHYTRVLCVFVLCAAALAVASAAGSCGIDYCSSCLNGKCIWCEDGYYVSDGTCKACTANCRTCGVAGRCTSCLDGYQLSYAGSSDSKSGSAKYGTCIAKGTSSPCSDPKCTSCLEGFCLFCKSGYYVKDGVCTSCEAAHCSHCEAGGHCLACDAGYVMKYVESTDSGVTISSWGTCSNGVVFSSAYAVLIGLAVIILTFIAA